MASPTTGTILKSVLISVISRGVSIVGFWLVSKGLVGSEVINSEAVLIIAGGVAVFLIDLGWIFFNKIRTWYLVEAARKAEPGAKMTTIKAEAKSNSPV